jgi:hypothetical protein
MEVLELLLPPRVQMVMHHQELEFLLSEAAVEATLQVYQVTEVQAVELLTTKVLLA